MKSTLPKLSCDAHTVALFTRAWIEIYSRTKYASRKTVALFTRAWIEIERATKIHDKLVVALFTRAWIEIRSAGRHGQSR